MLGIGPRCGVSWRGRQLFFFQAEDGIRDLVRSRGLGDVYKRQAQDGASLGHAFASGAQLCLRERQQECRGGPRMERSILRFPPALCLHAACLLYTSDAADERSSGDLGGRRLIKKNKKKKHRRGTSHDIHTKEQP